MTLFLNGKKNPESVRHWCRCLGDCISPLAFIVALSTDFSTPAGVHPIQSATTIKWQDKEGHSVIFTPCVLKDLPINLWERDILEGMGAMLFSPNHMVSHMMGKVQQG
jgi:hypothetical protein